MEEKIRRSSARLIIEKYLICSTCYFSDWFEGKRIINQLKKIKKNNTQIQIQSTLWRIAIICLVSYWCLFNFIFWEFRTLLFRSNIHFSLVTNHTSFIPSLICFQFPQSLNLTMSNSKPPLLEFSYESSNLHVYLLAKA